MNEIICEVQVRWLFVATTKEAKNEHNLKKSFNN